jgi:hypothetical protein
VDSICSVVRLHSRHIALSTVNHCMSALAIAMSARAAHLMSPESMGIRMKRRSFTSLKIRGKQGSRYGSGRMMAKSISPAEECAPLDYILL